MKNIFSDRGTSFFDLFEEMGGHVVSCARHLQNLAGGFPASLPECRSIHEEEEVADDVNHRVLRELNRVVIPPIASEDVYALAEALDDVIDAIDESSKRFCRFGVRSVEEGFRRQTDVLVRAADKVQEAIRLLRRSHWLSDLRPTLEEIHRLESLGDDVHHAALAELFDGSRDLLCVLKWKELYAAAEEAIDACESVGHTLERIALGSDG